MMGGDKNPVHVRAYKMGFCAIMHDCVATRLGLLYETFFISLLGKIHGGVIGIRVGGV